MPYIVDASIPTTGVTHTPAALCRLLGGRINGVAVAPPTRFGFPSLGGAGRQTDLGTNATAFLPAGSPLGVVRCIGLVSCACVIYMNVAGDIYVHHAPSGAVTHADLDTAIQALGGVMANVFCIYAHNEGTDADYTADIANIVRRGIPTQQVTEIIHLKMGRFGINSRGWLGY